MGALGAVFGHNSMNDAIQSLFYWGLCACSMLQDIDIVLLYQLQSWQKEYTCKSQNNLEKYNHETKTNTD